MRRGSVRWLDIVCHRVRRLRAPYLLIVQHPDIAGPTMLTAPVTLPVRGDIDVTAPVLIISDITHRVRLLDIAAIPREMLGDTVMSATDESDAITAALDIILHGYPVGRPF
jgi:hypothetical protein